jgi:dTDP-glucose 4,6-dehydratase
VGSEQALTIHELAQTVAAQFTPVPDVIIEREPASDAAVQRYIPSTRRAQTDLGLQTIIQLPDAIQRTILWHRQTNQT